MNVVHCNTISIRGKATEICVREFCGIQLCVVLHCCAKWATGIPVIYVKKQDVSDCTAKYEPDGWEFESLRARQFCYV